MCVCRGGVGCGCGCACFGVSGCSAGLGVVSSMLADVSVGASVSVGVVASTGVDARL